MRLFPILAPLAAALLAGCASNTGVLSTGPNAYSISVERSGFSGGRAAARKVAFTAAADFCRAKSLQSEVLEANPFGGTFESDTGLDLAFTCVPLNAPGPGPQTFPSMPAIGSSGGNSVPF